MTLNTDPKSDTVVRVRTSGTIDGCLVDLEIDLDVRRLRSFLGHLKTKQGFVPARPPLIFERTAEGHPICPRHGAPMRLREKQGDQWYSHKVVTADSRELYCRGYHGPESPGFDHDPVPAPAAAEPEAEPGWKTIPTPPSRQDR